MELIFKVGQKVILTDRVIKLYPSISGVGEQYGIIEEIKSHYHVTWLSGNQGVYKEDELVCYESELEQTINRIKALYERIEEDLKKNGREIS